MRPTKAHSQSGLTLVEVMIATSLSAVVMLGMLTAFTFLGKNLGRLRSTENFDRKSQRAMILFAKDIGTATKMTSYTGATGSFSLSMNVPSGTVNYAWSGSAASPGNLVRTYTPTSGSALTETLVSGVTTATLTRRDGNGNATTTLFNTRQLQLELTGAIRTDAGLTITSRKAASPNLLVASQALIQ